MDDRQQRRLERQFSAIVRASPIIGAAIIRFHEGSSIFLRISLAVVLIIGGLLAFLPILTIWLIPVGVLLLATDLPFLRPIVSSTIIKLRRRLINFRRRLRKSPPS
jgi:uncharacterized membrane protein